jgi:predicted transcriptional regulator
MKQTPCEYIVWHGLPVLRKEITRCMINDFGLREREAAEKLGVTPAAVSQYLSGKRGKVNINDPEVLHEINISTERIIYNGAGTVVPELCRLCKLFSKKNLFTFICEFCED